MCFGAAAFDTGIFQRAILHQKKGPLSDDMIILCVG